jgi:hypothetical protein
MKILNVTCVQRACGFDCYNVIVENWRDTAQNRDALYNACDRNNWGGYVQFVDAMNGIHVIRVKVYTD